MDFVLMLHFISFRKVTGMYMYVSFMCLSLQVSYIYDLIVLSSLLGD